MYPGGGRIPSPENANSPLEICCRSQFLEKTLCCYNITRNPSNQMPFLGSKTAHAAGAAPQTLLGKAAYSAPHTP